MTSHIESFDAIVSGAGPAGAICALNLARAGLRVGILEKVEHPRYKTCGGGLVRRCLDSLEVDVEAQIEKEVHRVELHLHDVDLRFRVDRQRPVISMAMRSSFDAALLGAAQEAGARLMAPRPLLSLRQGAGRVRVETPRGPIRANYLVAADGAAGPTAGAAGFGPPRGVVAALESEVRVTPATRARYEDLAVFEFGGVPRGYSWVFPKREHLSVGCLSKCSGYGGLRKDLERYFERLDLGRCEREDHGFVIPAVPRDRTLVRNRVLLTGDSAGLADPFTLEGLSNAVASGRLAAKAIVGLFEDPEAVGKAYQDHLEEEILGDLRLGRWLSWTLGSPGIRNRLFRRLGTPLAQAMTSVFAGEESYRTLLSDASRWSEAARRLVPFLPDRSDAREAKG